MTTDRIALLEYEAFDLEQDLLDTNPDTPEFWDMTARLEAIQATLRILYSQREASS